MEVTDNVVHQPVIEAEEVVIAESTTAEETVVVETSQPEEIGEETGDDAAPKKKTGIEKRFSELTGKIRQFEGRTASAEEYARQLAEHNTSLMEQLASTQKAAEPAQQQQMATRTKPTLADCEYDQERHTDELTDWKLEQRDAQRAAQQTQQSAESQQRERIEVYEKGIEEAISAGEKKFPDFKILVSGLHASVLTKTLTEAVLETSAPADMTYYLAKNPDEAERVSKLAPRQMLAELVRLEGKAIVKDPPKATTNAPAPVTPVGASAAADVEPDCKKDPDGWMQWERARVKKAGRRY